jgi:PRTRC genetic system protein B
LKFNANFTQAEAIQLKAAILLYGGSKGISYASVHEPYRDQSGAPYLDLDAGRPITVEFLRTMARGLGLQMSLEILPERVLARTPDLIAWWVPASVRPMFFAATSDGKTLNGKIYPHPPLVFAVEGDHALRVRALFENRRPDRSSTIGVAPYWNLGSGGELCIGSMPTPGSAGVDSLDEWVEAFFRSEFTHSGTAKVTNHTEGHLGLWRDLAGRREFPAEWLAPAGNLEAWLCQRH